MHSLIKFSKIKTKTKTKTKTKQNKTKQNKKKHKKQKKPRKYLQNSFYPHCHQFAKLHFNNKNTTKMSSCNEHING